MNYQGRCHCGKVAFEVEGELTGATACNCSMCSRKGSLLWFVPREQLCILTGDDDLATYTFNKHVIKHRFCPT
ncbi:MAG TPA: GFA family protein, partial [Candidatus Binatia bacterium]